MGTQFQNQGTFAASVRSAIQTRRLESQLLRVNRDNYVYATGQPDLAVYLIDSGQVKVLVSSLAGRECITALHGVSDMFGEMCLVGHGIRQESTVAQTDCVLRRITDHALIALLQRDQLNENFIQHLAQRMAAMHEILANLLTGCTECRLAAILIMISERLARTDGGAHRAAPRLRQDELADMTGTTRTRVGVCLKRFRSLGLIELDEDRGLVIFASRLREFIQRFRPRNEPDPLEIRGPLRLAPAGYPGGDSAN